MKLNLKTICLGALAACTFTACDLDTAPTTSLDADAVYKNTENADRVMRGVWNYIFNSGSTYASIGYGAIMMNDDFAGSDVVRTTSYGYSSSYNLTNGYGRGEINNVMWDMIYDPINNCNAVLANIDNIEGDQTEKDRIKGQAYATRGFLYMLLASHYSFAIDKDPNAVCAPIYTEPTSYDMATTGKPASSVSEVYAQALADLKAGYDLIPTDYNRGSNSTDQYKIDHTVVTGLLARTSLYAREWQDAYNYADEAMNLKNRYLMSETEYKSGFNDALNQEWMWGYSCTIDDNLPAYNFYFKDTTTPGSYYSCLNVDPYFKELFEDNDYRKDMLYWGPNAGYGEWIMLNSKFKFADIDNMLADLVLMRVSEMYLIKAEAAAHLAGKTSEAQSLLKELRDARMKAGYTAAEVTATGDDLLKEIWLERRKELWGEGFALTDIIRNQQAVERKSWQHFVECTYSENEDGTVTDKTPIVTETGDVILADDKDEAYQKKYCLILQGHSTVKLPDDTDFVPNSKYYLFRITEQEELQNLNLYNDHPKLDIYR